MPGNYIEPHYRRNHSSVGKLVHVPKRERRSKSVGRSFWSSLTKPFTFEEISNDSPLSTRSKGSTSPSITSRRSLDFDSTADEHLINRGFPTPQSTASSVTSLSSRPSPLPRKTSLTKSQISGVVTSGRSRSDDSNMRNTSSRPSSVGNFQGLSSSVNNVNITPKTKTSIVVHMRKNTRTNSASNSEETLNSRGTHVSNIRITPNINSRSPKRNEENNSKKHEFLNNKNTHSSQQQLTPSFDNNFLERVQKSNNHSNKMPRTNLMPKKNRSFEDVHRGIPFAYPAERKSCRNVTEFGDVERSRNVGRDKKLLFDRRMFKSQQDLAQLNLDSTQRVRFCKQKEKNNLELNSLQVFRQPKYKTRNKSVRNINNRQHLEQNENCKELVKRLSQSFHPNVYENQNSLSVFQNEIKSGFITSSRQSLPANNRFSSDQMFPRSKKNWTNEPIYAEIDEFVPPESHFPALQKRVTFSTTHQTVIENDLSNIKKKVLPATLWGVVEVKCALRERHDTDRRNVAKLCYHAIKSNAPDHSIKVLGKIDRSRFGESVYVVLEEGNFEVRDGEGLIVSKHKPTDISVIQEIEEDPNLFIYIGRCKFGGRIGMVVRFNKHKHLDIIIDFFR